MERYTKQNITPYIEMYREYSIEKLESSDPFFSISRIEEPFQMI